MTKNIYLAAPRHIKLIKLLPLFGMSYKSPTYDKLYAALIEKYKGTDQKILHDDLESLINKYIKIGAVMALGD